jgi:PIN domain nuclease of toxin-antitoxin system
MLVSAQRIAIDGGAFQWLQDALAQPGIYLEGLSPEIAVESCNLPGKIHSDPADRIIVATDRLAEATLITRDAKILQYGKQGHVNVLQA